MRKQTKLVAVLSTAALLAIGASMTSFAATGWAEEDGTWVYYERDGERATDKWAKSGNNWYYLDDSGEMAIDQLIEYNDDYYYVDINGVMTSNQWMAIDNEDAGNDNEPDQWWYYFQANGKALKGPDSGKISLKTINGKKYAFNDEGQMLYGWIKVDDQSIYNDDDDAWQEAEYYFGDQNDGAMTTGWLMVDITDENAESQDWIAPVFTDDEDQTRYFYFKSNGKKVKASSSDEIKEQSINGKKYGFDQYGRMVAEWSYDQTERPASSSQTAEGSLGDTASDNNARVDQTRNWKYFQSVEDGRKLTKDWFRVVAAENLDGSKYDDDADEWYYVDGSGNLYANQIKTIKGKKYAFGETGICLTGLQFIQTGVAGTIGSTSYFGDIMADDDSLHNYDDEDSFNAHASWLYDQGYSCYYFGDDGAMRTGKTTVNIDGDNFNFYFGKSGSSKGTGKVGEEDKKYYNSGKLMSAGGDEKFQVVYPEFNAGNVIGYKKYADAAAFASDIAGDVTGVTVLDRDDFDGTFLNSDGSYKSKATLTDGTVSVANVSLNDLGLSASKLKDDKIDDLNIYVYTNAAGEHSLGVPTLKNDGAAVVNTSGKISENNSKNKDGNDVTYKLYKDKIAATFAED